jgi:peptidoglycan/xylan/chitin deacetylase (PgdA/CDA1 family)
MGMRILTGLLFAVCAIAQQRTVAITVDDLPYVGPDATARRDNRRQLAAFRERHVPVTAFVIGGRIDGQILREWLRSGFDLANHSYTHPNMNELSIEQIEDEIARGEAALAPYLKEAGKKLEFFRFPMNHTGNTKEKHDAVAAFLAKRGMAVATCTIENSDYLFNRAYIEARAKRDAARERKLRAEYLAFTAAETDFLAGVTKQVFGYEPPQVMLLHDNPLNADVIGEVLKQFEERGYRFVTLKAAQSDAAYKTPDTYITKFGPMWGYRWAVERGVKIDGGKEPEVPKWVQ